VDELITQVRRILGTDKTWNVLLVGAGNLGRALSAYRGFDAKGFRLVAVFDSDPTKVGHQYGDFVVQSLKEIEATVRDRNVRLAILAVPADAAQEVADRLVDAGIRGLLNFAPLSLNVPSNIALTTVDVAVQLEQLSFQVNATDVPAKG
jgi:redox-sensing transcriptional repressor